MSARMTIAGLDVARPIVDFVAETLPSAGMDTATFWAGVAEIIRDLTPQNRALIAERARLQGLLDEYHRSAPGRPDPADYRRYLEEIGYLVPEPDEFVVETSDVDSELALQAGPQLVVPLLNARFAVNAANARWGSLYDALYGTDAIPDDGPWVRGDGYNPERGREVIRRGRDFLDRVAPLAGLSHAEVDRYAVVDGALAAVSEETTFSLRDPEQFVGFQGDAEHPTAVLLIHHGLHAEIALDRDHSIGAIDRAGVKDIVLESAVTTIMDLEDSVAAVDAEDKALGYRNWRDLLAGSLSAVVAKGGVEFTRSLNPDRVYTGPDGTSRCLPGRSMLLVRNVGHLMSTDAVRDEHGDEVQEGILDAILTTLGAVADLRAGTRAHNSRVGSLYIVKPKMHGPAEVAFAAELFRRVEELFGLGENTLKIGIMDEERRTTLNLRACIKAARARVVFINTGFLDRTGDEIRTSTFAGPMLPKARMKEQPFMLAYERANVQGGLSCGLPGRAQIGKGMWAMPDLMGAMLEQKSAHLRSGATTAWVPSPTAATLHALHYHDTNVFAVQRDIAQEAARAELADLLTLPLADQLDPKTIAEELDNNVQSILGYVVRWIDQGIGCSKVPDIHGVALMEDRATLRISSQLLANWLIHGVISEEQVDDSMRRLAAVVDHQNADDPAYESLRASAGGSVAFQAARRLILEGVKQPSGYTEPILHELRRVKKAD